MSPATSELRFPRPGRLMTTSVTAWLTASTLVAGLGWLADWPPRWGLVLLLGLLSLAIALLSLAPLWLVRSVGPGVVPAAVLASTTTRLCLTVMLVVGLSEIGMAPRQMIGLWAILWYALMMTAELSSVIRYSFGNSDPDRLPVGEPKGQ